MKDKAMLYEASRILFSTLDLQEVMGHILAVIRDHFMVDNIGIWLLNPARNELVVRSRAGQTGYLENAQIPFGSGFLGKAAQIKDSLYAPDVSRDPRCGSTSADARSELALPLIVRQQVIGVVDLQSDQLSAFSPATIDLLMLFAAQAAIAMENARLYSVERRRASQLEAINAVAKQTAAMVDIDELLGKVCGLVLERFHADEAVILLLEGEKLSLRTHQGSLTACVPKGMALLAGQGLSRIALEEERTIIENDVASVEAYLPGFKETKSEMCVPLIAYRKKLGVLVLDSARAGAFHQEDIAPLEAVADICASGILNAQNFYQTRQLAYVDGLTGIFNRRFFELRIAEELVRAERYSSSLTVILFDIDHFKKLNDDFGHVLGDEVLQQVSRIFQQQLRKGDVVCRFGGEEFSVLATNTNVERGRQVAEKLRQSVEQWLFPGVPQAVTVSAGVSEYPRHGATRDDIVSAADHALYAAKQAGRNRVIAAGAQKQSAPLQE